MTECERTFTITSGDESYVVHAGSWATLNLVWASQKCMFMPGSIITITDDQGNAKTFIKE